MAAASETAAEGITTESTTTETVDANAALKFAAAYSTLLEDSIKFRKFDKFLEKIKKIKYPEENEEETETPKLKIVVVGDSISAGGNNHPRNTWFERFVKKLKDNIEVDAEYINMCIHGTSIYQFADTSFILSDHFSETIFPWIVTGKTWIETVTAQTPDVVIIAFGANYWANAAVNAFDEVAWNSITTILGTVCDIVAVTPFLGITQGTYKYTDKNGVEVVGEIKNSYINAGAETQRAFARKQGWNIIDVNNISNLLTYRKMILNETPVYVNSFAEFRTAEDFKNCELYCEIDTGKLDENGTEMGFSVRTIRESDSNANRTFVRFAFCKENSIPVIKVTIDAHTDTLIHTIALTGNGIQIKVLDDVLSVNEIELGGIMRNLFSGAVEVDAALADNLFTTFTGTIHYPTEIGAGLSDEELLGRTIGNEGYEGNGINHPTALGEYFNYVTITQMYADKMIDLYRMATI